MTPAWNDGEPAVSFVLSEACGYLYHHHQQFRYIPLIGSAKANQSVFINSTAMVRDVETAAYLSEQKSSSWDAVALPSGSCVPSYAAL